MRIRVLSDLHLEFHRDGGEGFVKSLDLESPDVVVLAGDILLIRPGFEVQLDRFTSRAKHVVYVAGNHEYYRSTPDDVHDRLVAYEAEHPNFHWLHNSDVTIEGQRFIGTTLWFETNPASVKHQGHLSDFNEIRGGFSFWVDGANRAARKYLRDNVRLGDVVVTHHLPSFRSVHPKFEHSPLNAFFVCEMEDVLTQQRPRYWVHGHTHAGVRYFVPPASVPTEVVCNPFGYRGENPTFDPGLTLTI
jgi:predicted phosphodiesterase